MDGQPASAATTGWYLFDDDSRRYWDGHHWSDPAPLPLPQPEQTANLDGSDGSDGSAGNAASSGADALSRPEKTSPAIKIWLLVLGLMVAPFILIPIGVAILDATSSTPTTVAESPAPTDASSGESPTTAAPTPTLTRTPTPTPSVDASIPSGDRPPTGREFTSDASLGAPRSIGFGNVQVPVTVTNSTSSNVDYAAQVEAINPTGSQMYLAESWIYFEDVEPGESASGDVLVHSGGVDVEIRFVEVSRTPALETPDSP